MIQIGVKTSSRYGKLMKTRRIRSIVVLVLGMLIVAVNPASGKELEDRKWIEVRTPNFHIRSALSEKSTVELARYLETFRVAVSLVTNISRVDSPIPTEIYALKRQGDLKLLGIESSSVAGIFSPGLRRNIIVIRNAYGKEEIHLIMHEYVHFLTRNHGSLNYPKWYDEGFAEYLGASRMRSGNFEIGVVPDGRRGSLAYSRWIPLREILAPTNYDKWNRERKAMFYAEAWALVHFLQNRPDHSASFRQDLGRYIELIESGMGDISAFEEAFAITAYDLNKQVKRYLESSSLLAFQIKLDDLIPDFEPDVISLSREQVSLGLAQAALRLGEYDSAERWFTIATTDETTRPQAEAGLGDLLKFGDEFEAAQPYFERAIALAPDDPYIQLDLAEYWHDRASDSDDPAARATYITRARTHYVEAWRLDDTMPETYTLYAQTFLMEEQRYDFAVELLEQAESILPSNITVRRMLAEAYMGAGRTEEAIAAARSVLAWSHNESAAANRAREILAELTAAEE